MIAFERDAGADPPRATVRPSGRYVETALGLTLLFALVLGCAVLLRPFFVPILWAAILVVSSWPLYCRLVRFMKGHRTTAALLMTIAWTAVLFLPLFELGARLTDNVTSITEAVRSATTTPLPPPPAWLAEFPVVGKWLESEWLSASNNPERFLAAVQQLVPAVRDWLLARGADVAQGLLQLSLSLFTSFFFYRDGPAIVEVTDSIITRITGPRTERFSGTAAATMTSVVYGLLGTSLVQGILSAATYKIAGVPGALLLGFVSLFLSLIPAGLTLIWLPAAIWLGAQGATGWAAFVAISGLIIGSIDNFLRPYLIRQGSDLPFLLVLIGVVGGAVGFGVIGIFLGPALLGIGYSLIREWASQAASARPALASPVASEFLETAEPRIGSERQSC